MSIYPVYLSKFHNTECPMHELAKEIVKLSRCHNCENKIKWRYAYAHHSLLWGYGDIWCSKKCYEKEIRDAKTI